jgi:hypothetical protein
MRPNKLFDTDARGRPLDGAFSSVASNPTLGLQKS